MIKYKSKKIPVEFVDHIGDIALLKSELKGDCVAPLDTEWLVGDKVYSYGYQYDMIKGDLENFGFFPIRATIAGFIEKDRMFTLDEAIDVKEGSSGGPVLNRRTGKVIGIISHDVRLDRREIAFALSLQEALENWKILARGVDKFYPSSCAPYVMITQPPRIGIF